MKILVSACLLGVNCKYNGGNNRNENVLHAVREDEVIPICPEQMGGLPTPRLPSEIRDGVVVSESGESVDREFRLGAKRCLELALREKPDVIILKSKSPSCGVRCRYDGTFTGTLAAKPGVTAELLLKNGFHVIEEGDLGEEGELPGV